MTIRQRRVERPIASATLAAQSPMAMSQEQQRAPIKRPESSDEDENNNRRRAAPSIGTGQVFKSKRSHCSSLNLSCSSSAPQRQLATCVTQSAKSAKVIAATSRQQRQQAALVTSASTSVKRALEQEARVQRLTKTLANCEARKPLVQVNRLRWKSSTSALNCNSAEFRCQSASSGREARSHLSERVSSRGQWCCELPHHATAAHLNTRRQSNLAPLLNKAYQSSLSLVSANARQSLGDKSARPQATATERRAATSIAAPKPTDNNNKTSKLKPQAISRLQQLPQATSQVTNSRLRQGALFARRQLLLLPSQALVAPSPRLESRNTEAPRRARAQSVAPMQTRTGASKLQANSAAPVSKPNISSEARRRATRQMVVVAADSLIASEESRPLKLVKAEKKASHLTSSSSSLSLSAFKVKRPRQQHQSSTSSSCSSISTASRRWSSSSGAESPSLSQSCSQLATNLAEWPQRRPLIESNKTGSDNFGHEGERANARKTPTDGAEHECSRLAEATDGQVQRDPKQPNRRPTDFGPTKQDIDQSIVLLDAKLIRGFDHITNPVESSNTSQSQTAASESGSAARPVSLVQSDEEKPIDQQVNLHATIESIQPEEEDADIVAIGCSPLAFVVAAPSALSLAPPTTDTIVDSGEKNELLVLDDTMATTNAPSCNTNQYQLIVANNNNNNHNAENDPLKSQEGDLEKNVDMQISLDFGGDDYSQRIVEKINNNIDVVEQREVASTNKGLISPLDLSTKTFGKNDVSQEPTRTPPIGLKNQPLGPHQSMNISVGSKQLPQSPTSISALRQQGNGIVNEHFSAIDLTLIQADQTSRPDDDGRDPSHSVRKLGSGEPLSEQNVIATQQQQKMAEIPIRLEPISDFYDMESRPFARGKFAQVKRCTRKNPTPTMTMGECYAAKCMKKRRRLVDIKHEILLEIEALKLSYQTEHIVRLYEVYETQNEMFLVLEMAKGGELQRVLDDEEQIEEPLVRKMIDQILEGLIHLHDNEIAHLDIKPQNLLLSKPFPHGDIKLCDFGISRRITKDCEIREICGTPDYVAPEILRYDPISLATDMWSLGVLTYVLLSGYSPFGSENKQKTFCNITQATLDFPQEIFAKISNEAVDFVRKLIVREPSERMTSREAKQHKWISNHQTG